VTVHSTDEEAADLWKKIAGFSDDKIIRIPTDDNFWQMGDTGPCGPCSEIFSDQGEQLQGGPPGSPDENGDRFLEFWNLVFMQYEQEPGEDGEPIRRPLPKPSIDTGMGLERMAALMQGKVTNYDIDLLKSIIDHSADLTGVAADSDQAASHRVISDHLRCSAFLLADGVMPSNEGRGYVLRRIMRRGMRHAHLLGAEDPLMYKLLPTLTSMMGDAYPELKRAESLISETLKNEETRFKQTLDRGLKMLDEESQNVRDNTLAGDVAFKLYDTYGFPVDLTADALKEKNIAVDIDGFNACMKKQKEQSRASWSGSGDAGTEKLWFELLETIEPTEFLGYKTEKAEGQILALVKDGKIVDSLTKGDEGAVIVNQTPFYGESGGQVGDQGALSTENGKADVTDVKKQLGKLFAHYITVIEGDIIKDDSAELEVDHDRRSAIQSNHSVTHLLHEALRRTLGDHVAQKGSLQDDQRTRFDISQPVAVTADQLKDVEAQVNAKLLADYKTLQQELKDLGGSVDDLTVQTAETISKENKKLQKQISDLRRQQASENITANEDDIKEFGDVKFISKVLENFPAKDLKSMADDLKKKIGSGVVALISIDEGKVSIVVGVTSDLTDKINAVDLVKLGAEALGGKGGGGRPDMAQAGGSNPNAANDAVSVIEGKLG